MESVVDFCMIVNSGQHAFAYSTVIFSYMLTVRRICSLRLCFRTTVLSIITMWGHNIAKARALPCALFDFLFLSEDEDCWSAEIKVVFSDLYNGHRPVPHYP